MAVVTLEKLVDKVEDQWPLYVGFGVTGYIVYRIIEGLYGREKERRIKGQQGTVGGGGGSASNAKGE